MGLLSSREGSQAVEMPPCTLSKCHPWRAGETAHGRLPPPCPRPAALMTVSGMKRQTAPTQCPPGRWAASTRACRCQGRPSVACPCTWQAAACHPCSVRSAIRQLWNANLLQAQEVGGGRREGEKGGGRRGRGRRGGGEGDGRGLGAPGPHRPHPGRLLPCLQRQHLKSPLERSQRPRAVPRRLGPAPPGRCLEAAGAWLGPLIWGSRPTFSRDQEALHLGATQLPRSPPRASLRNGKSCWDGRRAAFSARLRGVGRVPAVTSIAPSLILSRAPVAEHVPSLPH